jgi:hypothetical protein
LIQNLQYEDITFQRFNDSLDTDGEIQIAGFSSLPSRILYEMDIEAYKEAYIEFQEREFEELKESVYNQYPACISYNFRLSEKGGGAKDPVKKLLHLKDTWESIIFTLYGLVFGEVRRKAIDMRTVQVFRQIDKKTGNIQFESFNTTRLATDALKTKILNIKAISEFSRTNNLGFKSEVISQKLLDKLLELQDIRNDISHHTTPTNEQAKAELEIVIPVFKEMLMETQFLAECKILRFDTFSSICNCQVFNGHSLNNENDDFTFSPNDLSYVLSLGQEQLFVYWDNEVYSLSPFLHFSKDNTGHETYLSFFKSRKEVSEKMFKYYFEPVKLRNEDSYSHLTSRFETEKDTILDYISIKKQ